MESNFFQKIAIVIASILCIIASATNARPEECLAYEPAKVMLEGIIIEKIFPGPPEFESIERGDRPEKYWVLKLSRPTCVKGDPKDEINDVTEKDVKNMQLVLGSEEYTRYKYLVTKKVIVTGTLFHAITAYHHTNVLLEVISIRAADTQSKQ